MPQSKSSNEFTSKLIETVKKHECIWNTTLIEHSKRNIVEDAWKQIAEELERSGATCREKWKNVKTGFLRNIGEYTSRNRPNSAKKKFYLYNEMEFLLPFIKKVNNHKSKKSEFITFENEEEIQYCGIDDTLDNINKNTLSPFTIEDSNDKDYNSSNPVTVPSLSLMTNNDPFQSITNENDKIDNQSPKLNELINDKIITVIPKYEVENNSSSAVSEHIEEEKTSKSKSKLLKSRKRSYPKQNIIVDELELEILKYLKRKRKSKKQITDDECSLMKFFKSNIPDILSLSKKNQRVFKMKMLNIIEELHNNEKIPSTTDNASS